MHILILLSNKMKSIDSTLFIALQLVQLMVPTQGLQPWCRKHVEGFTLEDDYNPNSPPSRNFTLRDVHVLSQVDEVRQLCTDINFQLIIKAIRRELTSSFI